MFRYESYVYIGSSKFYLLIRDVSSQEIVLSSCQEKDKWKWHLHG